MLGVFFAWSLVQTVRTVDPDKYRELTEPTSIWGRHSWVNPRRFRAFINAGDPLGSDAVASKLNAYRAAARVVRFAAVIYVVCALALFLMMIQ
jgi:hypothetical protein